MVLFHLIVLLGLEPSVELFFHIQLIPSANEHMGLFPLRRSSSMCSLEAENSKLLKTPSYTRVSRQLMQLQVRLQVKEGIAPGPEERNKRSSDPMWFCPFGSPAIDPLRQLQAACSCHQGPPRHVDRLECHSLTTLNYSPALGAEVARGVKVPAPTCRPCQTDREQHTCASAGKHRGSSGVGLAHTAEWREEGELTVLEGCCTPRGPVLAQFTPQAIERACSSRATACFPGMARCPDDECVSIWWLWTLVQWCWICISLSICRSLCVCLCVCWCVSMCTSLLSTRNQELPEVWNLLTVLLTSHLTVMLPEVWGFAQHTNLPGKSPLGHLGRQEMPEAQIPFWLSLLTLCMGDVPGPWGKL